MTVHPFRGGRKAAGVTKKHQPLIWECMLGTVYARDPANPSAEPKYFDYNWNEARAYARVADCGDLRISRNKNRYAGYPPVGKLALWGTHTSIA